MADTHDMHCNECDNDFTSPLNDEGKAKILECPSCKSTNIEDDDIEDEDETDPDVDDDEELGEDDKDGDNEEDLSEIPIEK